jgi:3-hydroxypropanoate dehydrogenase
MGHAVDDSALDTVVREARTYTKWLPTPVTDQTLRDLYDLLKWAPTSANSTPARFAFLRSREAKEQLRPALAPKNVEKTLTAPATVIVAYDLKFYEHLPKLFPQNPGIGKLFESNAEMVETTAKRNSSLQGAYLISCSGSRAACAHTRGWPPEISSSAGNGIGRAEERLESATA